MKKRKLRIVALMLLVALIIPCYANAGDGEAQKDKMLTDEEQIELMMRQAPAMAAYEQLMTAWSEDCNENGFLPEAFGGFYHTNDFKLAIKVVGNNERFIEETKAIVDDPSILEFIETDISLRGLMNLSDELWDMAPQLLSGSKISQENSTVQVSIKSFDDSKERMRALLQIADMEHVEIITEESPQMQVSYNTGKMIYTNNTSTLSSKGCEGTLGWYGTYKFNDGETRNCFITAGHVERAFKRANSDMFFGQYRAFSRAQYPTSTVNTKYCEVKCGDAIVDGYPSGESIGDYAIMATGVPNSGATTITPTNVMQLRNGTITVTNYLGKDVLLKILNGQIDVTFENTVYNMCKDSGLMPGNTRVAKGAGRGLETSTWGTVEGVYSSTTYLIKEKVAEGEFVTKSEVTINGMLSILPGNANETFSVGGDSGAPVYYMKLTNEQGTTRSEATLIGIISGGPELSSSSTKFTYITPTTILVSKGFIPYVG